MKTNQHLLLICGALALGEALGTACPTWHAAWPVVFGALVLTVLLGHGLALRGWTFAAIVLLGLLAYLLAIGETERDYRERPWMRNARRRDALQAESAVSSVHHELARRVNIGLDHAPDLAAINRAILLGDRKAIPYKTKRAFVEAGTVHVFAISGLHVMIIARLLVTALVLLACPIRFAGLLSLPILWSYVALIGFSPSAVRAATMATFYFLAPVFWRRPDGLSAWALTFLIVHLVAPLSIANVGSLLSFSVMLALVLAGRWGAFLGKGLKGRLWIGFATWAAAVPIAAHVFGRITPGGLLANLILIPTAEVTVQAGAIGIAASLVSDRLAAHVNNLAALFTKAMVDISYAISDIPFSNLEIRTWRPTDSIAWYAVILLTLFLIRSIRSRKMLDPDVPIL